MIILAIILFVMRHPSYVSALPGQPASARSTL